MNFPPLSYIITNYKFPTLEEDESIGWIDLPHGRKIYYENNLNAAITSDEEIGAYVLVLGFLIDLPNEEMDNKWISSNLLTQLLKGEELFFESINNIAGRYIIVYKSNIKTNPKIIGDACGTLKITYDHRHKVISSNIFLIDNLIYEARRKYRKEFLRKRELWKFGSLGNLQPLQGIKILTPNHSLDLKTYKVSRFYPIKSLQKNTNIPEVAEHITSLIERQKKLLEKKFTLVNSLTAGIDSRFSLVFSIRDPNPNEVFFTYLFQDPHMVDAIIANQIAEKLSLNHILLFDGKKDTRRIQNTYSKVIEFSPEEKVYDQIKKWDWYQHGADLVNAYINNLIPNVSKDLPPLHIRSNLYEIGRVFWGKKEECHDYKNILKRTRKDWDKHANRLFRNFFKETELYEPKTFGYNLLDLFYWEHRCGTWVSEVLQGTDFAFNTHTYINCRKIIELFLSVPFEERVKASIFNYLINNNLAELNEIPFNPIEF